MSTTTVEKTIQWHITPNKKPTERQVGSVDYKTGEFKGKQNHKSLRYPPKQFIPYSYTAYVKKVIPKTGVYEGEVKFIPLTEKGGEHMELRYLSTCPSLDRKYQEKNGYKPVDDVDGIGKFYQGGMIIEVPVLATNELFRTFMENHPNNGDSINHTNGKPVYFKIRNGKADVQARRERMEYEKKLADFKYKVANDDNTAEVLCIIYKVNPTLDPDSRKDKILEKFDETNGVVKVMNKASEFFNELEGRFQYLLDNNVIEVSNQKLIYKADKKPLGLDVELGVDSEKYSFVFVNKLNDNYKLLAEWLQIEKKLIN